MTERQIARRVHYFLYIVISLICGAAAIAAILIQVEPFFYVVGIKFDKLEIPWDRIMVGVAIASLVFFFTICIRIACCYIGSRNSSIYYGTSNIKQFYQWCMISKLNNLKFLSPITFISLFLRIYRYEQLENSPNFKIHTNYIITAMSLLCGLITFASVVILLECLFRMVINAAAFIMAYSLYFSNILAITIPFAYYIYATISNYRLMLNNLYFNIKEVLPQVDDAINKILESPKGIIQIYFKIRDENKHNSGPIKILREDIDLPEMLFGNESNIRLKLLETFKNIQFDNGTHEIAFHYYKRNSSTILIKEIKLSGTYHILNKSKNFESFRNEIKGCLKNKTVEDFEKGLVQVCFKLGVIDGVDCVGIPMELFHWIRYHSPLSFSLPLVMLKIAVATLIYTATFLAILVYANVNSFAEFNAAIAKLPISIITIFIALKFFQETDYNREVSKEMLLSYLIQYRRGYKFFYEVNENYTNVTNILVFIVLMPAKFWKILKSIPNKIVSISVKFWKILKSIPTSCWRWCHKSTPEQRLLLEERPSRNEYELG